MPPVDPKSSKSLESLELRVTALEARSRLTEQRLDVLEETVAGLSPCPDEPDEPDEPDPPVEDAPQLLITPNSFSAPAVEGEPAPAAAISVITNAGTGTLATPVVAAIEDPNDIIDSVAITGTGPWTVTVTRKNNVVGSYNAVVSITSPNAVNNPQSISFALNVTAPVSLPTLNLGLQSVSASVDEGLDATTVHVGLFGLNGVLQTPVAAAPTVPWISGVVITGSGPWDAAIVFDSDALAPGTHHTTLRFTSPNATNNPRDLPVTLTVVDVVDPPPPPPPPPPSDLVLVASPVTLTFNDVAGGGLPPAQVVRLQAIGTGTMLAPIVLATADPSGIIASAIITEVDSRNWDLTVSMAAKVDGTYIAELGISSFSQTNPPVLIPIIFNVAPAAVPLTFTLSPTVLNISVLQGLNATPANVAIIVGGDGILDTPTTGALPAFVSAVNITGADPLFSAQVVFNTSALAVGVHSSTISFSSTNGNNNPVVLQINVTVTANTPNPPPTSTYKGATLPVGDQQIVFNSGTKVFDNTVMTTTGLTFGGSVIPVAAGDFAALQTAVNTAAPGDIIQLVPGSVYIGQLTLPVKAGYVKIRSGTMVGMPAGERVFLSDIPSMATIRGPDVVNTPTIKVAQAAKFWYFEGINIAPGATALNQNAVVNLNSPVIASESDYASRFIFDRCVCVGRWASGAGVRRTFRIDAKYVAWLDCYLGDTGDPGSDAQAIYTNSGGHFKIINCYLSAIGEAIITGSAQTAFAGAHVHDLEIRRCEFSNRTEWMGSKPNMKNLFESKGLKRALFEGCYFRRNPASPLASQTGSFFLLTNYAHTGRDEENTDIVVYGIRVSEVASGFNHLNDNPRVGVHDRIVYDQIVMDKVGVSPYNTGDRRLFQILRSSTASIIGKITIHHVTCYTPLGTVLLNLDNNITPIAQNLEFKDSAVSQCQYGIFKTGGAQWTNALNASFNQWTFSRNTLVDGNASPAAPNNIPALNYGPSAATAVFVDPAAADYHIKAGGPGENGASDALDVGADIDFVSTLTSGCLTGIWP